MPGQRKERQGVVVSDKMDKTVVVLSNVSSSIRIIKNMSDNEKNIKLTIQRTVVKLGDHVAIVETRPLSREKRWLVRQS